MRARSGRPRTLKVVVTGPLAAGKSTFIRAISESTVLSPERPGTEGPRDESSSTTVAVDFGRLRLPGGLALYLFGTPGQERLEFLQELLAEGMLGFVLLVDAGSLDGEGGREAARIHEHYAQLTDVPYVVMVTKADALAPTTLARAREVLGLGDGAVPVVVGDARNREDVKRVLVTLLHAVLQRVRERNGPWTRAGDLA